ncbi:MAG: NAD(P)-dependent oxidoreductase [Candidatus Micrarchaeota archaeon]|nr:NAD(P)-dependent oxidoreductase [Candidatus Micrarchaeota archaeon]
MSKTKAPKRVKGAGVALVTGATSGIGRLLVSELLRMRYEVRVILRKRPSEHHEWKDLPAGASIYAIDISETGEGTRRALRDACRGVDVLFHLAAATRNYRERYGNEKVNTNLMIATNVVGTESILQAYGDSNKGRNLQVIYASSVAVYGNRREGETLTEESDPRPSSAYAESKYMAEQVIKAFAAANRKMKYTVFRIGVVYGENYESSFMRIFRLIKERKLRFVGKGENHLTLINVKDVVDAMLRAMRSGKGSNNRTYNLTDGVAYTQKELFQKAAKMLDAEAPTKGIHPLLARIGARARGIDAEELYFLTSDRIVSIRRISKELGFRPSVNIDVAGKRLAKEFLEQY